MMANDIALSAAIRSNLLALQNTQSLQDHTQGHLSTGLKVSSAVDDPVAYFQSKALSDRASDFQNNKDNIDQGISSLSTALQGITSIQTLVSQLKGLALSAQSASSNQIGGLVAQYNNLRTQINSMAADTSYQGLNLINGDGGTLDVVFSNLTGSNLTVGSVDASVNANGLNIVKAYTSNGGFQLGFQSVASGKLVGEGNTIPVTYSGTAALLSGNYSFAYGTQDLTIQVASAGGFSAGGLTTTANFVPGTVFSLMVGSNTFNANSISAYNVCSGSTGGNAGFENTSGNFFISLDTQTAATVTTTNGFAVSITIDGLTGNTLLTGTYTFNYGGQAVSFIVGTGASDSGAFDSSTVYHNGDKLTLNIVTGAAAFTGNGTGNAIGYLTGGFTQTVISVSGYSFAGNSSNVIYACMSGTSGDNVSTVDGQSFIDSNLIGAVNNLVQHLNTNLETLRSYAQGLGTNVALLNTRLDFTNSYMNLLNAGSGKLTLADLNQEGANLLALQTRQSLGIQSLSFAGQNEKSILQLFR
jgi:flagellin-like hook-associated protein FlgL